MSISGELESVAAPTVAADGLNEGDPREDSNSQGETTNSSAATAPKEPEKPKLWSEFSDDEDPIDTTLAREQLRKVCLASVGVRPCDVPTTSSQSLQRTRTTRYASGQPTYNSAPSHGSLSGRKGLNNRRSYNGHNGMSSPTSGHRSRRQDSLSVWQEAASKSRLPNNTPAPATPSVTTKRRFGGLSFDALLSYKSDTKSEVKGDRAGEKRTEALDKAENSEEKMTASVSHNLTDDTVSLLTDNSANESHMTGEAQKPTLTTEAVASMTQDASDLRSAELEVCNVSKEADSTLKSTPSALSQSDMFKSPTSCDTIQGKPGFSPRPSSSANRKKSVMVSSVSTCSSASVFVPEASRSTVMDTSSDDESDHDGLIEPRLREVEGDVIFDEKFDIWFTQPLSGSRRGLAKEVYENGMHLIGTFDTLAQFFEFHGILEWDDLPPSSVIAFCRHGIKPIWEDPANERGGRYLVKNFKREDTESVFTKMALGFLSGMLHDWKHYNLISLHVRESRRGNDIQLWRSKLHSRKLTSQVVKADLQDFVENSQPNMTLSFVPNKESLSRNDSRLQQQSGHRRSKGSRYKGGNRGATASTFTASPYTGGSSHPVFQLYAQKGMTKNFLAEEQKAAFARESEACLSTATPQKTHVTLSFASDDRLTSCGDDGGCSPVSSEDCVTANSFKRSDIDSLKSGDPQLTSSPPSKENHSQGSYQQNWRKSGGQEEEVHSSRVSPRPEETRDAAPFYSPSQSDYTAFVPPDVAMYYPHAPMSPASPAPYAQMYGYGYYMAQDQLMPASGIGAAYPSISGPWYDNSPPQTYWAPNCAPPDTFCLTPYAYPYAYTTKGTTYFSMPAMQGAATGGRQAAEASTNGNITTDQTTSDGIGMSSADSSPSALQRSPLATAIDPPTVVPI